MMSDDDISEMSDEEIRIEYQALLANARKMTKGDTDRARKMLIANGDYSQSIVEEADKRGVS